MSRQTNALAVGSELEEYRIESVLGSGGFGITYKAWDSHLETWVAIKEYFPVEWSYRDHDGMSVRANNMGLEASADPPHSDYDWGLDRFLDEARVLARVRNPFVVRINRYFKANGSAYIVMDYEEGEPLNALLHRRGTLGNDDIRGMLQEILPALQSVHEQGFLHRDIKPSNLYVRSADGCVILIDFGAARQSLGQRSKSVTGLVTPGYSPPEQYAIRSDRYGNWTDIYALGAVLYRCISGQPPLEAAERLMDDSLVSAREIGAERYDAQLLAAVDRALAVRPEDRYQTVAEMAADLQLSAPEPATRGILEPQGSASGQSSHTGLPMAATVVYSDRPGAAARKNGDSGHSRPAAPESEQNEARRLPAWIVGLGAGLAGVALGAIVLGTLWPPRPESSVSPVAVTSPPTVLSTPTTGETAATEAPAPVTPRPVVDEATVAFVAGLQYSQVPYQWEWLDLLTNAAVSASIEEEERVADVEQPAEDSLDDQVQQLLAKADESLQALRLTRPSRQSALYFYERVLKLDPNNREAQDGRRRIAERYHDLALREFRRANWDGAERFIALGLVINPRHQRLLDLEYRLRRTVAPQRSQNNVFRQPEGAASELLNRDSR